MSILHPEPQYDHLCTFDSRWTASVTEHVRAEVEKAARAAGDDPAPALHFMSTAKTHEEFLSIAAAYVRMRDTSGYNDFVSYDELPDPLAQHDLDAASRRLIKASREHREAARDFERIYGRHRGKRDGDRCYESTMDKLRYERHRAGEAA